MHQYMEDTIIILNNWTETHTWCNQCDMFVSWDTLVAVQLGTKLFRREAEQNFRRLDSNDAWAAAGTQFQAYYYILDKVDTFK